MEEPVATVPSPRILGPGPVFGEGATAADPKCRDVMSGSCIYCGRHCFAPRWHSEYRTAGPREEWQGRYQINQEADQDGGVLYLYAVCQPSCRANAAVARYEAARVEIAASLLELQNAVVEALREVGEAWAQLDR